MSDISGTTRPILKKFSFHNAPCYADSNDIQIFEIFSPGKIFAQREISDYF